jgi:TIR domain
MARSESCTELWIEEERQLSRELRLGLMDIKLQLYDKPDAGTRVDGDKEGVREYDNGTIRVTYTYEEQGDNQVFVFKSLNPSEPRLFVVSRDVFISYSHQDMAWFDRIDRILARIERAGDATFWTDKKIKAGERWLDVIRSRLDSATAAILLMSQSFLERPFIRDEEVPVLLDKADEAYRVNPPQQKAKGRTSPPKASAAQGPPSGFMLSWIPVRKVEPDKLEHLEQWERISQYQALGNPSDPLEGDAGEASGSPPRGRLKKLERDLLEFLRDAFETTH